MAFIESPLYKSPLEATPHHGKIQSDKSKEVIPTLEKLKESQDVNKFEKFEAPLIDGSALVLFAFLIFSSGKWNSWKLISQPNSLIAKVLQGIYYASTSFMEAKSDSTLCGVEKDRSLHDKKGAILILLNIITLLDHLLLIPELSQVLIKSQFGKSNPLQKSNTLFGDAPTILFLSWKICPKETIVNLISALFIGLSPSPSCICFFCIHACASWFCSPFGLKSHNLPSIVFSEWLSNLVSSSLVEIPLLAHIYWSIWKARNAFIFKAAQIDPKRTIADAMNYHYLFFAASKSGNCNQMPPFNIQSSNHSQASWLPPLGTIKLNSDASYDCQSGKAMLAFVSRSFTSSLIYKGIYISFCRSPFVAEVLALKNAKFHRLNWIACESDSLVVIQSILNHNKEVP
ncbi:conserved hypothetical protein [Ricinus communis]|uniref:RNase H type-1 domain-containing protein n=1 Tax=Ricinus communis TaxID=3988 RepID=B9SQI1_RICCO|nr:conserved hypothetical protein [Ricinus communis]